MDKTVAVEKHLSNVKQYFESKGYKVESFSDGQIDTMKNPDNYVAIIASGESQNFMGIEDVSTKTPIIIAEGLTPEEIFNSVSSNNYLH
jgi:hypothetical protein